MVKIDTYKLLELNPEIKKSKKEVRQENYNTKFKANYRS